MHGTVSAYAVEPQGLGFLVELPADARRDRGVPRRDDADRDAGTATRRRPATRWVRASPAPAATPAISPTLAGD